MSNRMTAWGVGPRLAFISLAYFALAAIVHISNPGLFVMAETPHVVFPIVGTTLIVIGLVLWALAVREIDLAFSEGRLLTRGAYAIVRNPMYSGFIVFVAPGIALWLRSWPLLTVPLVAGMAFKLLIKKEENYLEEKFGQAYLDYEAKVNALVPFVRFPRSLKEQG